MSNILGSRIRNRRNELGMTQETLAEKLGYTSRSSIAKIENGTNSLTQPKIEEFARVLQVTPSYLMGWEENSQQIPNFPNISPVARRSIPMLGEIACGKPIFINEEKELYTVLGADIAVDFCLKAKGNSMIGARIYDGDIVFIRKQSVVENGEIAAVRIGDEATLKRVYYYPDKGKLVLQAANPEHEPLVYVGEELNEIEILGKAIAFQSDVK